MFSFQEFVISGLYLYEIRRFLKPGAMFRKKRTRQVMQHLIYINVLIVILDLTLLTLEYANLFMIQGIYKATAYGIKLRLEFSILNQLMEIAQGNKGDFGMNTDIYTRRKISDITIERGSKSCSIFTTTGSTANLPNPKGVVKNTDVCVHCTRPDSTKYKDSRPGIVQQVSSVAGLEGGSDLEYEMKFTRIHY